MLRRLVLDWVYGGALASLIFIGLVPIAIQTWPAALVAIYLQLPVYMLHQLEEHHDNRFWAFVNDRIGDGLQILTMPAIFLINVPGVWGVILVSLLLAWSIDLGLGLIAVGLTLVNAAVHLGGFLLLREPNPGIYSATILFPVAGISGLVLIHQSGEAQAIDYFLGFGTAVLIHLAIVIHCLIRRRWLRAELPS